MEEGGPTTRPSSPSARTSPSARFIPAKDSARILDAVVGAALDGGRGAADARPPGGRLRRRQHRHRRRAHRQAPRRHRGRSSSTGARASSMPAHDFEVEEALEEGVLVKWLSTIKQVGDGRADDREDGARRKGLPAAHRRSSRRWKPTRSCWRSARTSISAARRRRRASRSTTASSASVGPTMMTGRAGLFAGGDMVPAERNVTVAHRPRQEGRAPHRRLAARHAPRAGAQARGRDLRAASTPGTTPTRRRRCGRSSTSRGAPVDLRRGAGRPRRGQRAVRGAPLPVAAATASSATTATACAPTTRSSSSARATASQFNYDYCKGCGMCVAECPCGAIEMVPVSSGLAASAALDVEQGAAPAPAAEEWGRYSRVSSACPAPKTRARNGRADPLLADAGTMERFSWTARTAQIVEMLAQMLAC